MSRTWFEGVVNPDDEHIVISYGEFGEHRTPVALVAPGPGRTFTVQFMLKTDRQDEHGQRMLEEVRGELDFHPVELNEPDPCAYPLYHCSTATNAYGSVHWSLQKGHEQSRTPEQN